MIMLTAAKIMIAFWFMCRRQNNHTNYGMNNKIKKWEQIKGEDNGASDNYHLIKQLYPRKLDNNNVA